MSSEQSLANQSAVKLFAVGDIMLGDSPYCFGHGVGSKIMTHGPVYPFKRVNDFLRDGDLVFGNLEIVISQHDRKVDPFPSIEYRAMPEAVKGLVDCGFDLFNVATNHTMEHGQNALEETLNLLAENNMRSVGVDVLPKKINRFCFVEKKGVRFCFLGYNFRPTQYFIDQPSWPEPNLELIMNDLVVLKEQADYFIVSLHWGDEFITYPSPEQVETGHALIDAGANIILGHHPHIVQGVENYHGGVIAYSLGNFVFDMWQDRLRKSMILECTIRKDAEIEFDIIPVFINRNHQPEILTGPRGEQLRNELSGLSQKIPLTEKEKYQEELKKNLGEFRKEVYKYYLTNLWRYKPKHLIANFKGAISKRL